MNHPPVRVIGPNDPTTTHAINTTSRSTVEWSKNLSPFFIGPCKLYNGYISKNMENAWQFSKVYPTHDDLGRPTKEYFQWASTGWKSKWAHRYPMGKGRLPLYSWWDGKAYDYIAARQKIYIPLYVRTVRNTAAFAQLKQLYLNAIEPLLLWDFDAYDHAALNYRWVDVICDDQRKMGHAFVLAMMLTEDGQETLKEIGVTL